MIEIEKLCKSYGEQIIYKDLNLSFKEQELTCIVGASGCGKTTLLRLIAGLESYDSGEIRGINDKKIAYVFQEDRLMPWLSVGENIEYVLLSYCDKVQIRKKVEDLLRLVQLMGYENMPIHQLSGGMQRRVAIARALAYDSDVLLLDEPFKGLDDKLKWHVLEEMQQFLKEKNRTAICVTHDLEVAERVACQIDIEKLIYSEAIQDKI